MSATSARCTIGYVMSRFPKLTETFVLYEMIMMERLGARVEIFPLLRETQPVAHPEAARFVSRARYQPFLSLGILRANAHFLFRRPVDYLGALCEVLAGTAASPRFFLGALLFFPKSVRFALDMQRAGVTHVHAHFATHPTLAALVVKRLTGTPFSFTAHGSDLHVDRTMLSAKVRAAAFAVTVSEYNRDVMARACGEASRNKIHVVHCGVEPERFLVTAAPRGERLELLSVASFEPVKGHRVLVDACRRLTEAGLRYRCRLVGDGPLRSEIESRISALGLGGDVEVLGPRSRDDVVRLLREAHVVVLASVPTPSGKREGIPVALMEAMASARPVVASRLSGIPELVEDGKTGLLCAPGNAEELAAALLRLARAPDLRERMGRAGRERVVRDFDLRTSVGELLSRIEYPALRTDADARASGRLEAEIP